MATQTPKYKLIKQGQEEYYNVDILNENMDIIDVALQEHDLQLAQKADKTAATASKGGLMSADDKSKLDTVEQNANNYVHPSDTNTRHVTDAEKVAWNGKASTATATTSANGLMSGADKAKLDGIAANANNYTHPATHPASMITGLPASLPANGGNADTVDGYHFTVSTTDLAAGSSPLTNNMFYCVYQ
ncbi:MAG TPA: hypothetical protein GXX75_03170 [Clostridiales bacterium]|nr:hypothetical protein [Clostridiales bacterium]